MRRLVIVGLLLWAAGLAVCAAPELSVDAVEYDAGIVFAGTLVTHTFVLTNVGDATLSIDKVVAQCGCTTTALATKELAPGESTSLTAKVSTGGQGSASKTITVTSNDGGSPSTRMLTIRYTVRPLGEYGLSAHDVEIGFYVLVDLREPGAYEAGHILGAINLPFADIETWKDLLPTGVTLVFYDRDDTISREAVTLLRQAGVNEAIGLWGGLDGWLWVLQDGDPLTSAALFPPDIAPALGPHVDVIPALDLRTNYFRLLIDLRTAEPYAENHLLGAINLPFVDRETWLPELPTDVELVFYDFDETLSNLVVQEALDLGLMRSYSLEGGLANWFTQYNDRYLTSLDLGGSTVP